MPKRRCTNNAACREHWSTTGHDGIMYTQGRYMCGIACGPSTAIKGAPHIQLLNAHPRLLKLASAPAPVGTHRANTHTASRQTPCSCPFPLLVSSYTGVHLLCIPRGGVCYPTGEILPCSRRSSVQPRQGTQKGVWTTISVPHCTGRVFPVEPASRQRLASVCG